MPLQKPRLDHAPRRDAPAAEDALLLIEASRPLAELLASGGDGRLALTGQEQKNAYGCTPFPRPALLDFGSSTASSISGYAYTEAEAARAGFWLKASQAGVEAAFDDAMESARDRLRNFLSVQDGEIIFSPSGTDAQLQVLYLVKALLGTPLVTIIVGTDQTGSGTAYTARGQHFSDRTSLGISVEKGGAITGLADQVTTIGIPFCDESRHLRSAQEMDEAVTEAVTEAIARGGKVLLQIMNASKLGWRAPSDACVAAIADAWPDDVRIVVDACQLRIGKTRLKSYLDRGYYVAVTGSKYFTGPPFSGALLVPASESNGIGAINSPPGSLGGYSRRFDWPRRWPHLRDHFSNIPNFGQWLRWEATLEEMRAYFAVPPAFRDEVLQLFAARVPAMIAASKNLKFLTERGGAADPEEDGEMANATIFSFVPERDGKALSPDQCAALYRAMGRDLSRLLPDAAPHAARRIAGLICQTGQPVVLRHRPGAVLRLCASARLVTACHTQDATAVGDAAAPMLGDASQVIQKLDWLIDRPGLYESPED